MAHMRVFTATGADAEVYIHVLMLKSIRLGWASNTSCMLAEVYIRRQHSSVDGESESIMRCLRGIHSGSKRRVQRLYTHKVQG